MDRIDSEILLADKSEILERDIGGRHEYKIEINRMDYMVLISKLKAVLRYDKNARKTGSYKIRSLYFDTPSDRALREKIDGVNKREKFRLRYYNNSFDVVNLEKKSKQNNLCFKESAPLNKRQAQQIINGDIDWMSQQDNPLVLELYSKMHGELLRPKTIVEYIREPFVYPAGNVRVTIDRNIKTGLYSTDFFSGSYPAIPVEDDRMLMEVKYDNFLPQFIAQIVQVDSRRSAAFSKYAAARVYM